MSKNRKRIFPKPPQRLTTETAEKLGKNSHKFRNEWKAGMYYQPAKHIDKPALTKLQLAMLSRLKRNV